MTEHRGERRVVVGVFAEGMIVRNGFRLCIDNEFVGIAAARFAVQRGAPLTENFFKLIQWLRRQLFHCFDAQRALRALSIETVEQLAAQPLDKLEKVFGQWGTALYRKARGGDSYEFIIDAEPKSISHNHTFGEDTDDDASLTAMLSHLSQKACKRLREAGLATRTL